MADDLASTPVTGYHVQACGDAHLANFGVFATPERNLVFDVNDFDETLPAPWEWDVKRLAASVAVAARNLNIDEERARARGRGHRARLPGAHDASSDRCRTLDVWYDRVDVQRVLAIAARGAGQGPRGRLVCGQGSPSDEPARAPQAHCDRGRPASHRRQTTAHRPRRDRGS